MPGRAEETLVPLRAGLVPVPAVPQVGICEVCHSASEPSFRQCYPCYEAARTVGAWEVLPMAIGRFDSVVPSPRRAALEPVVRQVSVLADAVAPTRAAAAVEGRLLRADRFTVTRQVRGERVLVFDDTFTSGASLFSACAALRDAGAQIVGPLVIGRHVRPDREPSTALVAWLAERPWADARCCRCGGERADEGSML